MWKTAATAFNFLFPTLPLPDIIKGRDRINKLAISTQNPHIKAISRLNGRYAYYISLSPDNHIVEEWDLLREKRIA